ncbi:very low-density lipoprotein receptor isoform X2 [Aplysia californica]|uniref:Very low-density lipoprotein receptor isoform X2 n=1 Tax=Aplysia californica TaxID=6500 RepID=A0ABM1A3W0_APLCA|nr:very low-density lipoprotein receptor isoform X2 [Aplysia californica]
MRWLIFALFVVGIFGLAHSECEPNQFACHTAGRCINIAWKCDGDDDCHDNSDELDCPATTCSENSFQCTSGKCIPHRWTCDQFDDCKDGLKSDEDPEMCLNQTCGEHDFKCSKSGRCVPMKMKCDNEEDCPHGEDEEGCDDVITCDRSEFQCNDKKCISVSWRCDHHEDCDDGSDEKDCPVSECSDIGEKQCDDGECITDSWWCDGEGDCKDRSDESNCSKSVLEEASSCSPTQFQCHGPLISPECINMQWKCDGEEDCGDNSDELDCPEHTCEPGERKCDTNNCVKEIYFCDGDVDCQDETDEKNCNITEPSLSCKDWEFDCKGDGQECISDALLCDKSRDCSNGHDESPAVCPEENACSKTKNGGCSQICVPKGSGRECKCSDGYELSGETLCKDIDECSIPGTCSQVCTNVKGSYKCECFSGYVMTNHRYCKANEGARPELILSERHELRRYHLDTYHYSRLLEKEVTGAVAMDFDIRKNKVFWTDVEKLKIFSVDLKTNEVQTIVEENLTRPDGLAVDWVHQNLYLSDTGRNCIEVARMDGSHRKTIASKDLDEPRALVVDPKRGWIYWTDWGKQPKIEKCGMNGKERKEIVNRNIIWPNGLTIDYTNNRLYWVDAKLHIIGSSDLNGKDFHVILKDFVKVAHPFAITVFEDFLYWTDWMSDGIHKTSKFGHTEGNSSAAVTNIALNLKSPMDIHVYHIFRQPSMDSHCGDNNGGCSHLCLPVPVNDESDKVLSRRMECACPDGMILKTSSKCEVAPEEQSGSVTVATEQTTGEKAGEAETTEPTIIVQPTEDSKPEGTSEESSTESAPPGNQTSSALEKEEGKESTGLVLGITVAVVASLVVLVSVVIVFLVKRHRKKNVKSMNFDNPVYRKTTTDDQLIMEKNESGNDQMQPLNCDPEIV